MRGFGSNFKFPEGSAAENAAPSAAPAGNPGFQDDSADDPEGLYE